MLRTYLLPAILALLASAVVTRGAPSSLFAERLSEAAIVKRGTVCLRFDRMNGLEVPFDLGKRVNLAYRDPLEVLQELIPYTSLVNLRCSRSTVETLLWSKYALITGDST